MKHPYDRDCYCATCCEDEARLDAKLAGAREAERAKRFAREEARPLAYSTELRLELVER